MIAERIAVVGAGAWGTALANVIARAGRRVTLWARDAAAAGVITERRESPRLPGVRIDERVAIAALSERRPDGDAILIVVPAQQLRDAATALAGAVGPGTPVVTCAKGIERTTRCFMTEIIAECIPGAVPVILSGPSFAADVARGLPTAVTIAAKGALAARLQASLGSGTFRPYASDDLTGVALGGAAKNVYAIACGVVEGMGLGENARAALLARSFAELSRLGEHLGARRETLMGLSGLGDLVLTATSPSSRNFSFGIELGQGKGIAELSAPGRPLAEGVATAPALVARAKAGGVELPIAEAMADLLSGALPLGEAVMRLMRRKLTVE
jgi:glycerol-3-phosphate dehydrogenase (NAD(P)+)